MKKRKFYFNLDVNLLCILSLVFSFFSILFKIVIKNMGSFSNLTKISVPIYITPIVFLILTIVSIIIFVLAVYLYKKTDVKYFLYKPFMIIFVATTFLLLTNAPIIKLFEVYFTDNNSILISLMVVLQSLQERFGYLQLFLNVSIAFSFVSLFYLYTYDIEKYLDKTKVDGEKNIAIDSFKNKLIQICLSIRVSLERDKTDSFVESVPDIDYTKLQKSNIDKEKELEQKKNKDIELDKEPVVQSDSVEELLHYDDQSDEITFIKHIEKKETVVVEEPVKEESQETDIFDDDYFISIDDD